MADNLKDKAFNGILWSSLNGVATKVISFAFGVFIARLLLPEDYGIIAMIGIFMAISQSFVDSGFGGALIRKTDRTETDYNTVFYFNIAVSVFFYTLLWVFAPIIARFYDEPLLISITRVTGSTLIINALCNNQWTKLSVEINFKTKAIISVISGIVTGIVGLYFAYQGFGAWALVFQNVAGAFLRCILLWTLVRWRPQLLFSWKSFRELFAFGSKMLASGLLDTVYNNLYSIIIGKVYTADKLGNYSRAQQFAELPSSFITGTLQQVSYPVLSTIQDNRERLASYYRKFLNLTVFVVFPAMIGLATIADPMVRILLTDNWSGCIYYLQILCFAMMWYPVHAINLNLLMVLGRSDYFLKLEIIKKIIATIMLILTTPLGLVAMCYGRVATSIIALFLNTYYTKKLIGYGIFEQTKDMMHIIMASVVMGIIVFGLVYAMPYIWLKLTVGLSVGILSYFTIARIFNFEELDQCIDLVKSKLHRA